MKLRIEIYENAILIRKYRMNSIQEEKLNG